MDQNHTGDLNIEQIQEKFPFLDIHDYMDRLNSLHTVVELIQPEGPVDQLLMKHGGEIMLMAVAEWLRNCDHSVSGETPRIVGGVIMQLSKLEW